MLISFSKQKSLPVQLQFVFEVSAKLFSLSLLLVLFLRVSYFKQAISISSTMRPALPIKPPDHAHQGASFLPCPRIAQREYEREGGEGDENEIEGLPEAQLKLLH